MKIQDIQFILDAMPIDMKVHANNTACLAFAMGRAINCSYNEINSLYFAGLLHEAGKLIINDLLSFNNLSDELVRMSTRMKNKKHMLFTSKLIKTLIEKYPEDSPNDKGELVGYMGVDAIIMQTFENVDGTGEPNKIFAEEIDTLAKVLRISLEYDNYRLNGLTHELACKELKVGSGIIFPSRIIMPFIKAIVVNGLHKEYESENYFEIAGAPDFELNLSYDE